MYIYIYIIHIYGWQVHDPERSQIGLLKWICFQKRV